MQQVDLPMLLFCSHDFGNDINWLKIRIVGFFLKRECDYSTETGNMGEIRGGHMACVPVLRKVS